MQGAILPRVGFFTGGSGALLGEGQAEATSARDFFQSLGVPSEKMTLEDKSRNTWENGIFTRDMVHPKPGEPWLLVTSAWHMPRSVGIFRRLGIAVIPYPVVYRTFGDSRDVLSLATVGDRVIMLDNSIREWIGPLAYRLTGKSNCSVPGALTGGGRGFFHPLRKVAALIMRAFPFSREPTEVEESLSMVPMNLALIIANKTYSPWSFRPWILMRRFGIAFDEVTIPLARKFAGGDIALYAIRQMSGAEGWQYRRVGFARDY